MRWAELCRADQKEAKVYSPGWPQAAHRIQATTKNGSNLWLAYEKNQGRGERGKGDD